jgi:hypothetical protein
MRGSICLIVLPLRKDTCSCASCLAFYSLGTSQAHPHWAYSSLATVLTPHPFSHPRATSLIPVIFSFQVGSVSRTSPFTVSLSPIISDYLVTSQIVSDVMFTFYFPASGTSAQYRINLTTVLSSSSGGCWSFTPSSLLDALGG